MSTTIKFKKHITVVIDLDVGEKVLIDGWGPALDGKVCTIVEIANKVGKSESGLMVRIDKYPNWIDSEWITKITSPQLSIF